MPVSDEDITKRLQELLETVDMETTSGRTDLPLHGRPCGCPQSGHRSQLKFFRTIAERKLREMLEGEFGEDLKERKAIIRQEVWHPLLLQGALAKQQPSDDSHRGTS